MRKFILLLTSIVLLAGCNSGTGAVAHVGDTIESDSMPLIAGAPTPGAAPAAMPNTEIPNNKVLFYGPGLNISITYLSARVTKNQLWRDPITTGFYTWSTGLGIVSFDAQRKNDSLIADFFKEANQANQGRLMMSAHNSISHPNQLTFYIVTTFNINNSPIVEPGTSNAAKFYIAQGRYWNFGYKYNWWVGISGTEVPNYNCNIEVKTQDGSTYYIAAYSDNVFIVGDQPNSKVCN